MFDVYTEYANKWMFDIYTEYEIANIHLLAYSL
jgi:hypothetical protein